MTIAERITQLVVELGGNMSTFARRINVTPAYISKLGKNPDAVPSDRTISDICREFGINEEWLRTGSGEKYAPKDRETEIADAVAKIYKANDPFITELIKILANTSEEDWDVMKSIAIKLADASREKNNLPE